MVWHWTGDKQLYRPVMAYFSDAYMQHKTLMSYGETAFVNMIYIQQGSFSEYAQPLRDDVTM